MGFWNFLGGFAIFNAICDLFSGHSHDKDSYLSQDFHDYDEYDDFDDYDDLD